MAFLTMNPKNLALVFNPENFKWCMKKLFWGYIGLLFFAAGIGVWPWIFYQFWDNAQSGANVIVDWERRPQPHSHKEFLLWEASRISKPSFEYAMECFAA
jgi:hypothetical protein